jgi:hypothetical protein
MKSKTLPDLRDATSSYLMDSLKYQVERSNLRDTLMDYDKKVKEKRD